VFNDSLLGRLFLFGVRVKHLGFRLLVLSHNITFLGFQGWGLRFRIGLLILSKLIFRWVWVHGICPFWTDTPFLPILFFFLLASRIEEPLFHDVAAADPLSPWALQPFSLVIAPPSDSWATFRSKASPLLSFSVSHPSSSPPPSTTDFPVSQPPSPSSYHLILTPESLQ